MTQLLSFSSVLWSFSTSLSSLLFFSGVKRGTVADSNATAFTFPVPVFFFFFDNVKVLVYTVVPYNQAVNITKEL